MHENETLMQIARFRYLESSLQGEAAQVKQGCTRKTKKSHKVIKSF